MVKRRDAAVAASWWCAVAIVASVAFGVVVSLTRSRVGTLDLWYDDAWVALSTRASLSRAVHMGVGAPGFTIVVRWWMGLADGSIPWAQSFALVPLLFAPFVVFVGARVAGASRVAATLVACLCALSPMLLVESARVKQYTWEYALSAMLLAIAAAVRRDGPRMRWTILAACVVVVAILFSFVMLMPTALVALVLGVALLREARSGEARFDLRRIAARLAVLTSAGLVVVVWAAALLPHPPDRLQDHWRIGFLGSGDSLSHLARQVVVLTRGFWSAFVYRGSTVVLVVPVVLVAWVAVRRWRTVWWLLLAPVLAIVLSALHQYPLGSIVQHRVDAWLIPWIAVIVALAVTDLVRLPTAQRVLRRIPQAVTIAAIGVVAILLAVGVARDADGYPPTRAGVAVAAIGRAVAADQPAYVAKDDWPVDLLLPEPIRIVDDRTSESQFSVVLDSPLHTLHVEDPARAARELRASCGHTTTIVGVKVEEIQPVLAKVGCPFRDLHYRASTGLPHDNVVTVTLTP